MITVHPDGLILTDEYWDCECEINYIHSSKETECPICKYGRYESPDSRLTEVIQHGLSIKDERVEII